jgi:hypothetical protein
VQTATPRRETHPKDVSRRRRLVGPSISSSARLRLASHAQICGNQQRIRL